MLTAEQLYQIIKQKDDEGLGVDEQPKNRAAKALFSLAEYYKNFDLSDPAELEFSTALRTVTEKAEREIAGGADAFDLKERLSQELRDFNAAFDKLTPETRDKEQLRDFTQAVDALNPDELAYDRKAAALMESIVRKNDAIGQLRAGTHPLQTREKPMSPAQLTEMETANAEGLKRELALLMAMDDLRKAGDLKAALDPAKRKAEAEKVTQKIEFKLTWTTIEQRSPDAEGLARAFQDGRRPELAALVGPAAQAVEAHGQQDAEMQFRQEFQEMAENAVRTFEVIRQLDVGTHPACKDEHMLDSDLEDLRNANLANLRAHIATLAAMEKFRKLGDFVSATDPEKLEAESDRIMEEKAKGLDSLMAPLSSKAGNTTLADLFANVGVTEMSVLMGVAQKSVEQKDRQAALARQTGPENAELRTEQIDTQPEMGAQEPSLISPQERFNAKREMLQKTAKLYQSGGENVQPDINQFRRDLRELFALRELVQRDPHTPVTDLQVREQEQRIKREGGQLNKLYMHVLNKLSITRLAKVALAVKGGESDAEFKKNLMEAAELKKGKKQTGPTMQA